MNGPDPAIEINNVTFGYPPQPGVEPVLEDVTLRVETDDYLGVKGPNGGGKTTLLKIILGLIEPQKGQVTVLGKPPLATRSLVGYVPQQAWVDPSTPADVLDVVLMGRLGHSAWGWRYQRAHVDAALAALEQTDTQELAHRSIASLSGGQRQRVLIARALASDARLLLLDEPTAGVDMHMNRGLTDLLHRLNETIPIVLVSHDIALVSTHLKRVACLNRRLACHAATELTSDVVSEMYHGDVKWIRHDDNCPLADPGCGRDCTAGSDTAGVDKGERTG